MISLTQRLVSAGLLATAAFAASAQTPPPAPATAAVSDPLRDAIRQTPVNTADADKAASDAYAKMVADMQTAHQPKTV